jgi:hypothetical protein
MIAEQQVQVPFDPAPRMRIPRCSLESQTGTARDLVWLLLRAGGGLRRGALISALEQDSDLVSRFSSNL